MCMLHTYIIPSNKPHNTLLLVHLSFFPNRSHHSNSGQHCQLERGLTRMETLLELLCFLVISKRECVMVF
ncbi:hypothetical protein BT69DRAFT_1288516 [Atractiella rhizophila]|nr:hypothetical protein BT69DRAFT_1288516 [Atractiella rhizophila]